jgi:hypothetical protein
MRRVRPVLLLAPVVACAVLVLAGCVAEPAPEPTTLDRAGACAALEDAVVEFYDAASPGSTVEAIPTYEMPTINKFDIPTPSCAFQVRPDPDVIPGDVFTIEAFYLNYDERMTITLPAQLEEAGFRQKNPDFNTWAASRLGRTYSAAMLIFLPGDGQAYSEAVDHFRLLDLSIGQN